jgi:CRP-like cAMP-binding protein
MTTLKDLRDTAQHKLMAGDATGALKIFRLVVEGEPLDFLSRLKIGDCLLALGETKLAGAVYTAVAVYGIKAGAPLLSLVAIKMLSTPFPKAAKGLQHDLAALYSKDSPRVGRGVRAAPVELSAQVRDDLDLDYAMEEEELRRTTAQMAAYTENITKFPERVPPIPLFSGLSTEAFERVVDVLELRRFNHGEVIVSQGDAGDAFFTVAHGMVRVFIKDKEEEIIELARLGEGSVLGEMALLASEPRTASVDADGEAALLVFTREALGAMADDLPQVAALLERFAMERMVRNLLKTNPFFEPFDGEQRHKLLERFEAHKVPAGTVIVRQDEVGRGIYLILHGGAEVVKSESGTAEPIPLAELSAGDCFGEIACVQERPTTAKVTATKDSTIMFLPKEYFNRIIDAVPELGEYYTNLSVERLLDSKRAAEAKPATVDADGFLRI